MPDRTVISFDYAIKTVLRDKANFGILEGFLSELLCKDISIVDMPIDAVGKYTGLGKERIERLIRERRG